MKRTLLFCGFGGDGSFLFPFLKLLVLKIFGTIITPFPFSSLQSLPSSLPLLAVKFMVSFFIVLK